VKITDIPVIDTHIVDAWRDFDWFHVNFLYLADGVLRWVRSPPNK
jgi:hypothetical protein